MSSATATPLNAQSEPSPAAEQAEPTFERATLLIVDDDPGPRESLKIIFKDDYRVLTADSGPRALEILAQEQVHAAVLDIRMLGMSGIDLLGQIKLRDPDVAVIMLTAYETMETARQALRLGACDYLAKPFDLLTMRAAVAKAVERNRCTRQLKSSEQVLLDIQGQLRNYQIKEEMARKQGEIYGMVLHDINNPLTVISGLVVLANERLKRATNASERDLHTVKEDLRQIEQQVFKCLEVSRRYLGFIRRRPGELPQVSVQRVLADLKVLMRSNPAVQNNELVVDLPATDMTAAINGTDLVQILLNLVINGLQASATPHRVRVGAQAVPEPLPPDCFESGPHADFIGRDGFQNRAPLVCVTVADNGPGIGIVPVARIFEAYFTTKQPGKGTGLGLTIVAHLLQQANAGMRIQTTAGQGTTFALYIPAS